MADRRSRRWTAAVAISLGVTVSATAAGAGPRDSIATARDLYRAAAYEDALAVLDRLKASPRSAIDSRNIEQYRAFCMLALGRPADAERAIEAVVSAAPLYRPSESEASPRVRAAFQQVRRRMLPGIIQQRFDDAKAAFARKESGLAEVRFKQLIYLLNDPDIATAASQPPLSQIRLLAAGFRDLTAITAATGTSPPEPARASGPPSNASALRIYGSEDARVVPPVAVRQSLAGLADFALRPGMLEIIVDEHGNVETATLRTASHSASDRLVLETVKTWRYRPATLDGQPVKFRSIIQLVPPSPR